MKSMSLRIEFNDIRIEDHLLSSVYRNVFTFDLPPSKKGTKESKPPQNVSMASLVISAKKGFSESVHYSTKVFNFLVIYLLFKNLIMRMDPLLLYFLKKTRF